MSNPATANRPAPPDQIQRHLALDPSRSILVQAPAGSGKTDLLTRRFLRPRNCMSVARFSLRAGNNKRGGNWGLLAPE